MRTNLVLLLLVIFLGCLPVCFPGLAEERRELVDETYYVMAYKPEDPGKVVVKVSLRNQVLYVMEGERVLMVAACTVGEASTPTPEGEFAILKKVQKKRREQAPGQGYPMGYWCQFHEDYGIHAGWIHSRPRTNGTIRLHHYAAPKFYHLVQIGTPVFIAEEQAEDASVGKDIARPKDSQFPELPSGILHSDQVFHLYQGPLLDDDEEQETETGQPSEADPTPGASTGSDDDKDEIPYGIPVRGKTNIILSPYPKDKGYIDVEGLQSGVKIECPWSKKILRVP